MTKNNAVALARMTPLGLLHRRSRKEQIWRQNEFVVCTKMGLPNVCSRYCTMENLRGERERANEEMAVCAQL